MTFRVWGRAGTDLGKDAPFDLFSAVDPEGPCDVVLLLKRTGVLLGAWTRDDVPLEVVSVMTSTLLGCVESIIQAVFQSNPGSVRVETDRCQILITKLGRQHALVLFAPPSLREASLRNASREIEARLQAHDETHVEPGQPLPATVRKSP